MKELPCEHSDARRCCVPGRHWCSSPPAWRRRLPAPYRRSHPQVPRHRSRPWARARRSSSVSSRGSLEYLPVSSTGHLAVAERAIDIGQSPGDKMQPTATPSPSSWCHPRPARPHCRRFVGMAQGMSAGRRLAISVAVAFVPRRWSGWCSRIHQGPSVRRVADRAGVARRRASHPRP